MKVAKNTSKSGEKSFLPEKTNKILYICGANKENTGEKFN